MQLDEQMDMLKKKGYKILNTPKGYIINGNSLDVLDNLNLNADLAILDPPWFDAVKKQHLSVDKGQSYNFEDEYDDDDTADDYNSLLQKARTDPVLQNWKLPEPFTLSYLVKRNLAHNAIIYLFGYMPYLIDYHKQLTSLDYRFMFELIWGKSDRPAMGDGKYPLKAHANIWTYRQKDVTLKDTHFNIKRACINPEGEEEHRTKENPAGSKLKGTVQPSRLEANGTIVYRTGIGYPRSIVEAGVVKEYHEEYIGHPTQIPSMLLELLIKMATDENDLVVDPFFGSGTTGAVCERTNRRYVGIEITEEWFNKSYERIMREGKEREKTLTLKDYLKT